MWMGAALLGPASFGTADPAAASGKLGVTFLETKGHGLAIVVQTPGNRTYLIDTGNAEKDFDNGRDTIAPLLKARGGKEIDGIVISHSHADHYGGSPWLIQNMTVKRFIDNGYEGRGQTDAYRAIRKQVRDRGGETVTAHAGDTLDWDKDLTVEVLSPPKDFLLQDSDPAKVSEHAVLNNNSLTLRIQHGNLVFLFPGDAYGSESNYMAKNHKDRMRATVLCAPHHGFNSTPGYAQLVKPEVVVASCLKHYEKSQIASPADQAELIFKPVGAKVYPTAWYGTVEVVSDGTGYTVKTERTRESK
jgi:competence protein ComEC